VFVTNRKNIDNINLAYLTAKAEKLIVSKEKILWDRLKKSFANSHLSYIQYYFYEKNILSLLIL